MNEWIIHIYCVHILICSFLYSNLFFLVLCECIFLLRQLFASFLPLLSSFLHNCFCLISLISSDYLISLICKIWLIIQIICNFRSKKDRKFLLIFGRRFLFSLTSCFFFPKNFFLVIFNFSILNFPSHHINLSGITLLYLLLFLKSFLIFNLLFLLFFINISLVS